jgi:hypothetical protein
MAAWQQKTIEDFLKGDPLWVGFLERVGFEERAEHEKRRLALLERLKKKLRGPAGRGPDENTGRFEITLDLRKPPPQEEGAYTNAHTAGALRIVGFSAFTTKEEIVSHLKREELWPNVRRAVLVPWVWPVTTYEVFISNSQHIELDLWYKHTDDTTYMYDMKDERFFVAMLPKKVARAVYLRSTDLLKAAREKRLWKVLTATNRCSLPRVSLQPLYEVYRTPDYMAYKSKRLCMLVQSVDDDLPRRISLLSFLSPRVTVIVLGGQQLQSLFALQRLSTLQEGAQLVLFEPVNGCPVTKCKIDDIGRQLERLERAEETFLRNANRGSVEYTSRRIALSRFQAVRALAKQQKDVGDRELRAVDVLPDNTDLLEDETN